jgi:formyltetrahydrofolate hydrolase
MQKLRLEIGNLQKLEVQFQEVLQELVGDKSLEHFRIEYEKLHRALKKSHESEKRLVKKLRELNQEIVSWSKHMNVFSRYVPRKFQNVLNNLEIL